jgi:hypothetical protein
MLNEKKTRPANDMCLTWTQKCFVAMTRELADVHPPRCLKIVVNDAPDKYGHQIIFFGSCEASNSFTGTQELELLNE